jgi:hypothetical protein
MTIIARLSVSKHTFLAYNEHQQFESTSNAGFHNVAMAMVRYSKPIISASPHRRGCHPTYLVLQELSTWMKPDSVQASGHHKDAIIGNMICGCPLTSFRKVKLTALCIPFDGEGSP